MCLLNIYYLYLCNSIKMFIKNYFLINKIKKKNNNINNIFNNLNF